MQLKYLKYTNLDSKSIKLKQVTQNNKLYKYSNSFCIELVLKFNIIYNSCFYIGK